MDRWIAFRIKGMKCVIEFEMNSDLELIDWKITQVGSRDVKDKLVIRDGLRYRVPPKMDWLEKQMDMDEFYNCCLDEYRADDGGDQYYDRYREAG